MENDLLVYDTSQSAESAPARVSSSGNSLSLWVKKSLWLMKFYLTEHSAFYVALTHIVHKTPMFRRIAIRLGLLIPNLDSVPELVTSSEALTSSVVRITQLARGRNVILLIIPSRRLWIGTAIDRAEAAQIHETFVDKLRKSGMIVIDMRNRFERDGNPLSYHFANDGHWNAEGHHAAAEALAEVLQLQR
jgi:hypothetical protein